MAVYSLSKVYLVSQEAELVQEVVHQLEFVPHRVSLHLRADDLRLLTHVLLRRTDR